MKHLPSKNSQDSYILMKTTVFLNPKQNSCQLLKIVLALEKKNVPLLQNKL